MGEDKEEESGMEDEDEARLPPLTHWRYESLRLARALKNTLTASPEI
jgi:hypothetical protein